MTEIRVYFIADRAGALEEVVIEHPVHVRGIERIWKALTDECVDVTGARVGAADQGEGVRVRLFVTGRGGTGLTNERRDAVRERLVATLAGPPGAQRPVRVLDGPPSAHRLGLRAS